MARVRPDLSSGFDGSDLETNILLLEDGVTAPGTVSGLAQIYVDTADGSLKVRFDSGNVKTLATDS